MSGQTANPGIGVTADPTSIRDNVREITGYWWVGLVAGIQNVVLTTVVAEHRWVPALFSVLFLISALVCFASPVDTFAGLADMLGFLFLLVGTWWMVQAFLERAVNPMWWLTLISGILMTGIAFWTAGQLFATKAYTLLVFAGIWALMQGTVDIARAFEARRVNKEL